MASFFQALLAVSRQPSSGSEFLLYKDAETARDAVPARIGGDYCLALVITVILLGTVSLGQSIRIQTILDKLGDGLKCLTNQDGRSFLRMCQRGITEKSESQSMASVPSCSASDFSSRLNHIEAFSFIPPGSTCGWNTTNAVLYITDLVKTPKSGISTHGEGLPYLKVCNASAAESVGQGCTKPLIFGNIRLDELQILARSITNPLTEDGIDGLVLDLNTCENDLTSVHVLLRRIRGHAIPVVVLAAAHSLIWIGLDFGLVDGVILQHACIFPDGERRDFFRSSTVRKCAARCKHERELRPAFFFGFYEICDLPPSAAVLRRAYKLADFFKAVLKTEHAGSALEQNATVGAPLSAFDWLKSSDIVWLQRSWSSRHKSSRCDNQSSRAVDLDAADLCSLMPSFRALSTSHDGLSESRLPNVGSVETVDGPRYYHDARRRRNIWDVASCGAPICTLGHFSLRYDMTQDQYDRILRVQESLRDRQLLETYDHTANLRTIEAFSTLRTSTSYPLVLSSLLQGISDGSVRLFGGLDSGFTLPDGRGHFWAVSGTTSVERELLTDMYVSKKAHSDTASIWHAFLAHQGVPRRERYREELLLFPTSAGQIIYQLPVTIAHDLEGSSESELLMIMEQICISEETDSLTNAILKGCERLLIHDTTLQAWNTLHSRACLDSSLSVPELIQMRLALFSASGAACLPRYEALSSCYIELYLEMERALKQGDRAALNMLSSPLLSAYRQSDGKCTVTPLVDLYGLMFFCAIRKLAFENVYLETTDRCPLFLSQPDQSGIFAELWSLGSQCEIYFGITPGQLGEIIYERYQDYLTLNPPSSTAWDGSEVWTAYSIPEAGRSVRRQIVQAGSGSALVPVSGEDENAQSQRLSTIDRIGALSFFCIPAAVDVLLLTFTGRGLYVSAAMDADVKLAADYAIICAYLITSGTTAWASRTGSFYLSHSAFSNMVHFLVQIISATLMLITGVATIGCLILASTSNLYQGLIFVMYLYPLSVILTLLGIFATMHCPRSPLPSGRLSMLKHLPLLLFSPALSAVVHGLDAFAYLVLLWGFTLTLLAKFRSLCHQWTDWHTGIPLLSEANMLNWYMEANSGPPDDDSSASSSTARTALLGHVQQLKKQQRHSWLPWSNRSQQDPFVLEVSNALPFALFLLGQDCETLPTELLTGQWFDQLRQALADHQRLMRGLGEHSMFINLCRSKYDIGQNVALFLAALLDRLIMITTCTNQPSDESTYYATGLAVVHFLLGLMIVEMLVHRSNSKRLPSSGKRLSSIGEVSQALRSHERQLRFRCWSIFAKLAAVLLVVDLICLTTLAYNSTSRGSIFCFFAHSLSYNSILFSQLNQHFTGNHRMQSLLVLACCFFGFIIGCGLQAMQPFEMFIDGSLLVQSVASITAAIGTGVLVMLPKSTKTLRRVDSVHEGNLSEPATAENTAPEASLHEGQTACAAAHALNRRILGHLCLGVDIDVAWTGLPEDVRLMIVQRMLGKRCQITPTVREWLVGRSEGIEYHDQGMERCLHAGGKQSILPGAPEYAVMDKNDPAYGRTSASAPEHPQATWSWYGQVFPRLAGTFTLWAFAISAAASDAPRELRYSLRDSAFRPALFPAVLLLWRACRWSRSVCTFAFLIRGRRSLANFVPPPSGRQSGSESTAALRNALWSAWAKPPYLDGVTASFLDEALLRGEPLLRRHWQLRDSGRLRQAAQALRDNLERINPAIAPSEELSQSCPLLIKPADLFLMGLGKDANQTTADLEEPFADTEFRTAMMFSDMGCWPDSPGGVSNCRNDLVSGLSSVKGICFAESSSESIVPRYRIPDSISSIKLLPVWGLDSTACHGICDNLLQAQVDEKIAATSKRCIEHEFGPLLRDFVRAARTKHHSQDDLIRYGEVFVKMNEYFTAYDYNITFGSEEVWNIWLEAWLRDYDDTNMLSFRDCFEIERPSLSDFRQTLDLLARYLFIYSVELPANCPTAYQTTHHGLGSMYGLLLKQRHGSTWTIWEHAIFWRETCLNLSPAQCLLPLPVQTMLLAVMKLACHLAYTHVDIVVPCTSAFNPEWEMDLGTDQGLRGSKKVFSRKIDPIVNGIRDLDAFQPIDTVRSQLPTAVMLSNVQFIKDIKTAILAADVLINKHGFVDYRLLIYGAQDREPSYTQEMASLISDRGLVGKVVLAGFGKPQEVLRDAWVFVNSSISEALPLAIGEAALSGIPVVATDVGSTALVLTDPDDSTRRYGQIVPPSDPESLARAQLAVLAMMDDMARFTGSAELAPLPDAFTPDDVERVMDRMADMVEDRKRLGLELRRVALRRFDGRRYLREHEQMIWIQRYRAEVRRSEDATECHPGFYGLPGEQMLGSFTESVRPRWQTFGSGEGEGL